MAEMKVIAEPGAHAVIITSEFDAPRDLVFVLTWSPSCSNSGSGRGGSP